MSNNSQIFYQLSSKLTGYNLVALYGTGQGDTYYQTLVDVIGVEFVTKLLCEFEKQQNTKVSESTFENFFIKSADYGPICKNIIKMWYMGSWYQLPLAWSTMYVSSSLDTTRVISSNSYIEGLVWNAMGQHPKSAKQPGYATWSFTPSAEQETV